MNREKRYHKKKYFLKIDLGIKTVFPLWAFVTLLAGLVSCTKGTLDSPPDEGSAVIEVNWNGNGAPPTSGFHFYFYPQNGGDVLEFDASATGFEGKLPAGTYRVIACSTDARNVVYQGMESYSTASVRAQTDASSRATTYYTQPSGVYTLNLGQLVVSLNQTTQRVVIPDTLSKSINLEFSLQGAESIVDLKGLMRGVQPSVLISTKEPSGDAGITNFSADVSGNQGQAQISVLGILDPQGSLPYRNLMDLTMTLSDSSVRTTQIDLTELLSEALNTNEGNVPLEIPVEIELKVIDNELVANVKPWNPSSGQGSVK